MVTVQPFLQDLSYNAPSMAKYCLHDSEDKIGCLVMLSSHCWHHQLKELSKAFTGTASACLNTLTPLLACWQVNYGRSTRVADFNILAA